MIVTSIINLTMAELIPQSILDSLNIDTFERQLIVSVMALRRLCLRELGESSKYKNSVQFVIQQQSEHRASGEFLAQIRLPFNLELFLINGGDFVTATQQSVMDAIPQINFSQLTPSLLSVSPSPMPIEVTSLENSIVWLASDMNRRAIQQQQAGLYADPIEGQNFIFTISAFPDVTEDLVLVEGKLSFNWLTYMESSNLLESLHQLLLV